jgi:hypothetical protein
MLESSSAKLETHSERFRVFIALVAPGFEGNTAKKGRLRMTAAHSRSLVGCYSI